MGSSATLMAQQRPGSGDDDGNFNHGWGVGANVEHSDNASRVATDKQGQTSEAAFLRYDFGIARRSLALTSAADIEYRHYSYEAFDDGLNGGLNALLSYGIFDEYWEIHAQENYGQTRQDVYQSGSVNDRGYINEISVGTRIAVPLGRRLRFFAQGDYADVAYGESDEDNRRKTIAAGFNYAISDRAKFDLSASRGSIELKDETATLVAFGDYEVEEASLGFNADLSRTRISISGGKTRLRGDVVTPDRSLLRLELTREVGARFSFGLGGGTEYSDSAGTFVREQATVGVGPGGPNIAVSADPFKSDYASASVGYKGPRLSIGLSNTLRRERHEVDSSLDGKYLYTGLTIGEAFSDRTKLELRGSLSRIEPDSGQSSAAGRDTIIRLGFSYRLGRNVDTQTYAETTRGNRANADYRENRYGFSISYSPAVGR